MSLLGARFQQIDCVELQLLLSPNLGSREAALVVELGRLARRAVADGGARPVVVERRERADRWRDRNLSFAAN